jgi:glycosyltransferase involved in cell wall biosynthesis
LVDYLQLSCFNQVKELMEKKISIVVPCKNEELYIDLCIEALLTQNLTELIIVDNGSTDGTMELLEKFRQNEKVTITSYTDGGISAVRNYGAGLSTSCWLGFIDADVEVSANWLDTVWKHIDETGNTGNDNFIMGATYGVRDNPSWVESTWFVQLQNRDKTSSSYVNGGNMVLSKKLFEKFGGFDVDYQTGEDVELCHNAVELGARILKYPDLVTIHHGYPRTVVDFYRRERWHGAGMIRSLSRPWKARDLMMGIYFLACLIVLPWGLLLYDVSGVLIIFALLYFIPCFSIAAIRSKGHGLKMWYLLSFLWFVYGVAKTDALCRILISKLK